MTNKFTSHIVIGATASLAVGYCISKAYNWYVNYAREQRAAQFISERRTIDTEEFSPPAETQTRVHGPRYTPDRRKAIAVSLADAAYFKFGKITNDESNVLIVRKFIRDQLADTSLRMKDRIDVLERAVTMFFIAPEARVEMAEIESTSTYGREMLRGLPGRF